MFAVVKTPGLATLSAFSLWSAIAEARKLHGAFLYPFDDAVEVREPAYAAPKNARYLALKRLSALRCRSRSLLEAANASAHCWRSVSLVPVWVRVGVRETGVVRCCW